MHPSKSGKGNLSEERNNLRWFLMCCNAPLYSSHGGIIKLKNSACDLSLSFLTGDRSLGNVMVVVVDNGNGSGWKTALNTLEERVNDMAMEFGNQRCKNRIEDNDII
jgi:hypothetical protein